MAERAAGLKCHVLAANRSPVADPAPAETVFPLADLDRMLPLCDTVLIACARQKPTTGKVSFRQGPAEAMPLPDGCADLVFMSMIYHHLNDPAAVARECHRVLRPGGYVCVRNGTRETDFPRRQSAIRRPATVQPPQYGINAAQ